MNLKLEFYDCLCETSTFKINNIPADYNDFGSKDDHDTEEAEPYGCGNMQFDPIPPTQKVLDKYNISVDEYYEIAYKLAEGLSFGCCGWCI